MKFQELIEYGSRYLSKQDSKQLLLHIVRKETEKNISLGKITKFKNLITMARSHVPIQHLLGYTYFHSHKFLVNTHVLIPRQDTETLISAFTDLYPNRKQPLSILEVGVGSGCILLTICKIFKKSFGLGLELTPEALEMAIKNQQRLRVNNCKMISFDVLNRKITDLDLFKFDVLISNPPYISTEEITRLESQVRDFEPYHALHGGEDGLLFYHALKKMKEILSIPTLIIEIGHNQLESVSNIFSDYSLTLSNDLSGITRCLVIENKQTI